MLSGYEGWPNTLSVWFRVSPSSRLTPRPIAAVPEAQRAPLPWGVFFFFVFRLLSGQGPIGTAITFCTGSFLPTLFRACFGGMFGNYISPCPFSFKIPSFSQYPLPMAVHRTLPSGWVADKWVVSSGPLWRWPELDKEWSSTWQLPGRFTAQHAKLFSSYNTKQQFFS